MERFTDLSIPLSVVAADFFGWTEADISDGSLKRAVAASIALPVIFKPVAFDDRVLIDGGIVNPLPYDKLPEDMDIIVAVDVVGGPEPGEHGELPNATESIFGAIQLLMHSILAEKLKTRRPDVLLRPDINTYRVLEFLKTADILKASHPMREALKRELSTAIENWERRNVGMARMAK